MQSFGNLKRISKLVFSETCQRFIGFLFRIQALRRQAGGHIDV